MLARVEALERNGIQQQMGYEFVRASVLES